MAYEDNRLHNEGVHHLILENRQALSISGVEEVERFDEETVVMYTNRGTLVVHGGELHIEQLSLDGGELKISGHIDGLAYEDEGRDKRSFLSRLFR